MATLMERYLSPSEAARELEVSAQRVRQLIAEGKLAAMRTPLGHLVSREAVTNLREQRRLVRGREED